MQLSFFGGGEPAVRGFASLRRLALDEGSWIDYAPEFVTGHEALFARLASSMAWKSERRVMYEREVDVPRLFASALVAQLDPALREVAAFLAPRYRATFERIGLAWYRDGSDSVAWHRDKMSREHETLVCILSLGAPRKFMVRPYGGGASRSFTLGNGDLFVLGGWCQLRWEHCVPKQRFAAPRMSCMFRHTYE
jgi:alkylated DNA repair dioxygenase AlkB